MTSSSVKSHGLSSAVCMKVCDFENVLRDLCASSSALSEFLDMFRQIAGAIQQKYLFKAAGFLCTEIRKGATGLSTPSGGSEVRGRSRIKAERGGDYQRYYSE